MNNEKVLLGNGCTASYYRRNSSSPYIVIEDETDLALLTPSEAIALLRWLQEQRSNIEALQAQENTI
jgi:hypothetical protein